MWREVSSLLTNPEKIELEHQESSKAGTLLGNLEILKIAKNQATACSGKADRQLQRGLNRKRTIQVADGSNQTPHRRSRREDQGECRRCRSTRTPSTCDERFRELAAAIGSELAGANWQRRREIIRTLVQRIDTATDVIKITFRVAQNTRESDRILTPSRSHCRGPKTVKTISRGFGKRVQRCRRQERPAVLWLIVRVLSAQTASPFGRLLQHCYRCERA